MEAQEIITAEAGTVALLNKSEIDMQVATAHKYPRSVKRFRDETLAMVTLTAFWTLSTSEWNHTLAPSLSDDGVCSLSDILEDSGSVPQRYFLSAKACAGILRRAEKRGKQLPPALWMALKAVAKADTPADDAKMT